MMIETEKVEINAYSLIEKLDEEIFITIPKEAGYGEIKEAINYKRTVN